MSFSERKKRNARYKKGSFFNKYAWGFFAHTFRGGLFAFIEFSTRLLTTESDHLASYAERLSLQLTPDILSVKTFRSLISYTGNENF